MAITPAEPDGTTVDVTVTTVGWDTSATSPADQYTFGTASAPTVTSPTATAITAVDRDPGRRCHQRRRGHHHHAWRALLLDQQQPDLLNGSGVTEVDDSAGGTGIFTENVTGLTPGTTYYYVAFATNSVGTSYTSPVSTFTTLALPTVTSPTATAITSTTATLGGDATSAGVGTITTRGVLFSSTNNNPTLAGVGSGVTEVADSAGGTGIFTENVTGLTPGTTYYYVAFATNSIGTSYTSPVSTFSTTKPTVTSPTATAITPTTATLGGDATSAGGAPITTRGVLFSSTNSNPTLAWCG